MNVLLDNCVDAGCTLLFEGHRVQTAVSLGWARLQNGELIEAAAARFDLLDTVDKNIKHQHNLVQLPISILELNTRFSRLAELLDLAPWISQAVEHTRTHRFVSLGAGGTINLLAPFPASP